MKTYTGQRAGTRQEACSGSITVLMHAREERSDDELRRQPAWSAFIRNLRKASINLKLRTLLLLAASALLSACTGSAPVAYTGIVSVALLQRNPSGDDHVPLAYTASGTDLAQYTRMVIEPVAIYDGPDQQFGSLSVADRALIADYMHEQFAKAAIKRFEQSNAAGPSTLRLHLTLTGVETNTPVLSTVTKILPATAVLNLVQGGRGKEGTFSGSVSFEVQAYDSTTNRLLESYVSKQYPFAENIGSSFGMLDATRAGVRKGAEALVPELDRLASKAAASEP